MIDSRGGLNAREGCRSCWSCEHGRDHTLTLFSSQVGAAWQAQAKLEEMIGDFAADARGSLEDWLLVHGLPNRAGLDVEAFKVFAYLLAASAKLFRIDEYAG